MALARERPTAPYLATATNGIFEMRVGSIGGIPSTTSSIRRRANLSGKTPTPSLAWDRLALNERAVTLFSQLYGPYPFESVGGVMDWAPNVFYSLESQTRPMYWHVASPDTVVHEIAHMWFGDSVSLELWPDIWLNEGFATWSEWIYSEMNGGTTAAEFFDERYAIPEDTTPARISGSRLRTRCPGRRRCSTRRSTTAAR